MAVKLRLSRIGNKNNPVYRLVATDSRSSRDGKFLEILGTYHATNHVITAYNAERISYWVGKGAIQTDSFKKISKRYSPAATASTPLATSGSASEAVQPS